MTTDEKRLEEIEDRWKCPTGPAYASASGDINWLLSQLREAREQLSVFRAVTEDAIEEQVICCLSNRCGGEDGCVCPGEDIHTRLQAALGEPVCAGSTELDLARKSANDWKRLFEKLSKENGKLIEQFKVRDLTEDEERYISGIEQLIPCCLSTESQRVMRHLLSIIKRMTGG